MKPRIEVVGKLYVCRDPGTLSGFGFDYAQAWHQWLVINRWRAARDGMLDAAHCEHGRDVVQRDGDVLQNGNTTQMSGAVHHEYLQ